MVDSSPMFCQFFTGCGPHLEYYFLTNLHRTCLHVTRLGDIASSRTGHRHQASAPGFAMIGRNRGCMLERFAIGLLAGWPLEYSMASWHTTHMKPPIIGSSHRQAQVIVVGIGATDQHCPTTRQ